MPSSIILIGSKSAYAEKCDIEREQYCSLFC